MKKLLLSALVIAMIQPAAFAGKSDSLDVYPSRKHQLYFYWGWNRGFYSKSDLHFTGDNYDAIARAEDLTPRQVRRILHSVPAKK